MKLAQLNIAHAKYPLDHPNIKDFIDNLERVNAIAEQSEGFIWRLKDDSGDATSIQLFDDPNIIGQYVSMGNGRLSQRLYVFTIHRDFMRRKKNGFIKSPRRYLRALVDRRRLYSRLHRGY